MGRRGAVALTFAVAAVPIAMATATAVDFSRIAAGRAALQRAVDNAALSGATAYTVYAKDDTFKAVAVTVATSAFCNATTALPGGFTINTSAGGQTCSSANGPVVSGVIAGYVTGTPGIAVGSGCSATNTVVAGFKCGFVVTVTATAKTTTVFAGLLGASTTLSVTAMAVNPFVDLARALTPILEGTARYANSVWIYPLLLDANGQPDFITNTGALPDTSACTGDPTQTSCKEYSMVASTKYAMCKDANPCTTAGPCPNPPDQIHCPANSTIFAGSGGVVQNIVASSAVITATTPLGVAFQGAAGGYQSTPPDAPNGVPYNVYGYNTKGTPQPNNGCTWPATIAYNTVAQTYDASNNPLLVDANGYWTLPTHWFYSSYLAKNLPPSQKILDVQNNTAINQQVIPSIPQVAKGVNTPSSCTDPFAWNNIEKFATAYVATGKTNCSLYIVKNPTVLTPDPSYHNNNTCFEPTNTTGKQYAALSCQNYGKSVYAFFWNDMGGSAAKKSGPANGDDTDYGNGTLIINCAAVSNVILIN